MATGLFNLKQVNQAISQGAWSGYIAPRWVEYLVVAGGGGSGDYGGGGGGGGLLTGIVTVAAGASYAVTVGAGGAGGTSGVAGGSGVNSVFGSIAAIGGGGGGSANGSTSAGTAAGSGGSGGGGSAKFGSFSIIDAGQGTSGQGNAGGRGDASGGQAYQGGGGGGAGTVGFSVGTDPAAVVNSGGAGIASAISGTVTAYAGGGSGFRAGGAYPSYGVGGVGGGGGQNQAGGGNTGGGGGSYSPAPAGGSGIVVVRYPGNVQFYTGGTVTYSNGYIVHNFTANGTLAPTTPTVVSEYQISRSLRFNSADTATLSRTPSSATSRKIWTWSAWVKRGSLGTTQVFFVAGVDGSNYTNLYFSGSITDNLEIYNYTAGVTTGYYYTQSVFRDPSAWYHIVYSVDTTQATAADRIKIYVNGVAQPTTVSTSIASSVDTFINSANQHYIGRNGPGNASQYFDGYMTEVNLIDGQALTPTSFGYVNPATGVWSPAKYVGGYGTNGFYLNFSDNSNTTAATLGKDYSGNGNNWTPNNFSVTAGAGNDSLVDSPTSYGTDTGVGGTVRGNYCTLNPLATGSGKVLVNGNLEFTSSTSNWYFSLGTIGFSSGKYYWEVNMGSTNGSDIFAGIMGSGVPVNGANGLQDNATALNTFGSLLFCDDGKYQLDGNLSRVAYSTALGSNQTLGIAVDMDAKSLTFYKDGTSQGAISFSSSPMASSIVCPSFSSYGSGDSARVFNFGQRPFAYTAPSGFKALCTQNLPTPTIGATTATQANKYFGITLRNGGGASGGTYYTTIDMASGALLWDKPRSLTSSDHYLVDSVRGISKTLSSNLTDAERSYPSWFTSFNNGSYTTGSDDWATGVTIVDWIWAANGSGVTNTAGSITSTVSANTTSGFSVVTYTGTGSAATVGHGLGVAPSMIICKGRSVGGNYWQTQHSALGATKALFLNTTDAAFTNAAYWNNTAPTSTVFSLGGNTDANGNGTTYVAYCFAPIAGYSAFGSYTGNGSADGPFVYCGFRPAYVMIKATGGTGLNWGVWDVARNTYNLEQLSLYANSSTAEINATDLSFDGVSNGFKVRGTSNGINQSGLTFIFMAFAEAPFKYSLAR